MKTKKYYKSGDYTIISTPISTISKKEFNSAAEVLPINQFIKVMENVEDWVVTGFTEKNVKNAYADYSENQMLLITGGQIINDVVALVFNQKFYVIYNANNITYGELDTIFKMRKFTYKTYGV